MRNERPRQDDLPGQLLRHIAERFSSRATSQRILLPLLADLQFEYARTDGAGARLRVRLRWVLAFWQALGVEAVRASGQHLRANVWGATDAEREAARRLLPRVLGVIALFVFVFLLDQVRALDQGLPRVAPPVRLAAFLLLPSVLCIAIPGGLLLGTVWAAPGRFSPAPPWRSLFGIAALAGLVTFALAAWITPRANQTFRRLVLATMSSSPAAPTLARGDRELDLIELSDDASQLHASGRHAAAARLEVEWHKKPALGASCLALALAGAAITWRLRSRRGRWPLAVLVLAGWLMLLRIGEQAADRGAIAPAAGMWGPSLVVSTLALGGLARRRGKGAAV